MNQNLDEATTLSKLLKASGLTQKQLSERIGCAQSLVSAYCNGKTDPTFDKAIAIARILDVSLKTLAKSFGHDVRGVPDDTEDQNWG
jgi:transcriptional regulator with XRE-family HTH domain